MDQIKFELKNVCFSVKDSIIIDSVSLDIEPESTTAFLGSSGSGKTTLLKLLAGLIVPTKGSVFCNGKDFAAFNKQEILSFRKHTAFVFQDAALWANQNIQQTLDLPLKIHYPHLTEIQRLNRIMEICDVVGFKKSLSLRPSDLSTGEQKLAAFARAFICEPKMLFLDECITGLDEKNVGRIVAILKHMNQKGCALIYISHLHKFINSFPAFIYIIENGRILRSLPFETFLQERNKNEI